MWRSATDSKVGMLRRIDGLRACDERDVRELAKLVDEIEADAGELLAVEGRPARQSWIVVDGWAEVSCARSHRWWAGPGDVVGDLGLLGARPSAMTIRAATPLQLLVFEPRAMETLLRLPSVVRWLLTQYEARVRTLIGAPNRYGSGQLVRM